mmetsp:Transcript_33130/g.43629  ORF Transcript_33130/g.43629 Transcript_33130/m.43629 type:complete len:407 (+) Transcript_33130:163-1383(+)
MELNSLHCNESLTNKSNDLNSENEGVSNEEDSCIEETISQRSTDILKDWLLTPCNFIHPYPDAKAKKMLVEKAGLSSLQLKNWFTNARRRIWRPLMQNILNSIDLEPMLEEARIKHAVSKVQFHKSSENSTLSQHSSTEILKAWILSCDNFLHPYPTVSQRKMLVKLTNLTTKQLKNWFTNARRRIWKPMLKSVFENINLVPILQAAKAKILLRTRGNSPSNRNESFSSLIKLVAAQSSPKEEEPLKKTTHALDILSEVCSRSYLGDSHNESQVKEEDTDVKYSEPPNSHHNSIDKKQHSFNSIHSPFTSQESKAPISTMEQHMSTFANLPMAGGIFPSAPGFLGLSSFPGYLPFYSYPFSTPYGHIPHHFTGFTQSSFVLDRLEGAKHGTFHSNQHNEADVSPSK